MCPTFLRSVRPGFGTSDDLLSIYGPSHATDGSPKSNGLAKENTRDVLVGASGFEPEASCAQGRRATRLRYAPTCETPILAYFQVFLTGAAAFLSLRVKTHQWYIR